jgi:hypothetical protein
VVVRPSPEFLADPCGEPRRAVVQRGADRLRLARLELQVGERVRIAAETVYQALIEAELTYLIWAAPHERSAVPTQERRTPAQCRCS